MPRYLLAQKVESLEIYGHDLIEIFLAYFLNWLADIHTGVVYQYVNLSKLFENRRHNSIQRIHISHVQLKSQALAPGLPNGGHRLVQLGPGAGGTCYFSSLCRQAHGNAPANAATGAGHQGNSSL